MWWPPVGWCKLQNQPSHFHLCHHALRRQLYFLFEIIISTNMPWTSVNKDIIVEDNKNKDKKDNSDLDFMCVCVGGGGLGGCGC